MSGHAVASLPMNQPVDPLAPPTPLSSPEPNAPGSPSPEDHALSPPEGLPERIFTDSKGVRLGWRIFLYFSLVFAIARLLGWLGSSFFPESAGGVVHLWQEFYGEAASLAGALIAALILARIEQRSVDVYGLPRAQTFGGWFWIGAVWGLFWISALLLLMHGAHVFDFGRLALQGQRIWKFALFWGTYFVIVALFEEFLFRGFAFLTLSKFTSSVGLAGAIVTISFALQHGIQDTLGVVRAFVLGILLLIPVLLTGSLVPSIIAHAIVDMFSGLYGRRAMASLQPT